MFFLRSSRPLFQIFVPLAILVGAITGCGGGSGGTASVQKLVQTPGSATIVVTWPKSTRVIPGDAQSIEVLLTPVSSGTYAPTQTLTNGTDYIGRPVSGNTSTVSTVQLTPGTYTVTAEAFPATTPTGGGVASAIGSASLVISAGQTTPFSITMASTIDHLEVSGFGGTIEVSTSGVVTPGNGGSLTSVLIIPSLLNTISIVPKDASGSSLTLFPTTLSGSEITSADNFVIVGGARSSVDNVVGSKLIANLVANTLAITGFDAALTVKYSEAGAVLNSFTIPVHSLPFVWGGVHSAVSSGLWTGITSASTIDGLHTLFVGRYEGGKGFNSIGSTINGSSVVDLGENASEIVATNLTDGYYLSSSSTVHNFGTASTGAPNGDSTVTHLPSNLGNSGAPFVLDATGIYEVGVGLPVNYTLGSTVQIAVGAAPDGTNTYWSVQTQSLYSLTATDSSGVNTDTSFAIGVPFPIAADVKSPLVYTAIPSGMGSKVIALSRSGAIIGILTLDVPLQSALAIFVDGTTGVINGTLFGSSGTRSTSQLFYGPTGSGNGTIS